MKKAFTMIELVFVIVVIGILAAVMIPSTRTNPLQEAGVQLLSHIRYTQHLAMVDDKYGENHLDGTVTWYKKRWQLVFFAGAEAENVPAYTIFSDTAGYSTGGVNESEVAINPENSTQYMTGGYSGANALDITDPSFNGMRKMNLGLSYGVSYDASGNPLSGGCTNNRIAFDHLGRPMQGDQATMTGAYSPARLITTPCVITLSDGTENISIIIQPETGYSSITF